MPSTGRARNKEDAKSLDFMINHVFLPPCLPQQDDTDTQDLFATVQTLCDSVSSFLAVEWASRTSVQPALEMLERFLKTFPNPGLDATTESQDLHGIITGLKNGDVALFHLPAQNAGLLLKARQDGILFEAFELLAPNHDVMACKGALLREFPDRAAVVALDKIRDGDFLDVLVDFIQKLEADIDPAARQKVTKGGTEQPEERDTLSPILATGLLIDMLNGLGRSVEPDRVTKRSREHVAWNDAFLPFHRSAGWLLLRVALRLVLDRRAGLAGQESWYKPLMAYHHARILSIAAKATDSPIPSDKLFSMQAKLARRITKLNPTEETAWLAEVKETVVLSDGILRERWKRAQNADAKVLPLDEIPSLSFYQDSALKLQNLRAQLSWIKSRSTGDSDPKGPGDTTHFTALRNSGSPALSSNAPEDVIMDLTQLLDFEAWVESELPGWTDSQLGLCAGDTDPNPATSAVGTLQSLIDAYYERARAAYDGVPDALSVMYLVIMELWVALDKIAGNAIPLLLDYNPGFPLEAFCPLLLERREEMSRLKDLEAYLSGRQKRAHQSYPSAFEGFGRENSFAVRFFKTSAKHQRLRDEIESWGWTTRAEKLQEYDTMRARYNRLAESHSSTNCEYYWNRRWGANLHSSGCSRCYVQREIDSLRISVFEWPLPPNSNHADAVVVEISMPQLVRMWRDATWKLVTKVFQRYGGLKCRGGKSLYFAGGYCGLPRFAQPGSRLRPASTVKPMVVSHYRDKHILDATPENICVPHAAQYEYYDEPSMLLAIDEIRDVGIPSHCSYAELVKGIPGIEDWTRHAEHTSNDVIAGQYRCPLDTTLEEFRAFGNLRSGFTLQWANILSQLVMPSLDFNKKATFALVMQACLEAGPSSCSIEESGSIWREAHVDTQKESFIKNMLQALDDALERVGESWQNDIALCLLACLATRLLSLSPSPTLSNALLGYLARVRTASIAWARLLLAKLNHSDVDLERQEWAQRLLMAALISAVTFNVDEAHLASVLSNPQGLALFVESSLLARNHLPAFGRPSDPVVLQLVRRWHLVMYRARDIAMEEIVHKGNGGLDTAIRRFWAAYSAPSTEWMLPGLEARNHILERNGVLSVSFNLLTGNLFVNGYPLSKLPLDYQRHPTFGQLFGEQILDVGPSSIHEMQFSACREQNGWLVHFAMKDDQLVVRAVWPTDQSSTTAPDSDNDQVWEYIPRGQLEWDLPNSFVNNYAHWLNLSTDEVEFRPIENKWLSSSENWRLVRLSGSNVLKKGPRFVLDPFSPTARLAHKVLGSIESFWNIDTIFDRDSGTLFLELPRLCLSFSVLEGQAVVRSKNYTGMQVDQSQGIGTLTGLSDKLVLKPDSGPGFRIILVPRGQVSARRAELLNHVDVSINCDNDRRVRHDSFVVNDKLGCLSDTGSLQSKLYLCLLHALTSHSLPDPLTGRTGTEEALRILRGAAVKSYLTIDHGSREFLSQIAKLSPQRRYYPPHLSAMEQTTWNSGIPPLSQHDDFWQLAKDTYNHYERLENLFHLDAGNEDTPSAAEVFAEPEQRRSTTLAERARIRNAIFRTSEFGAESHTTAKDKWYRPSDRRNPGSVDDRAKVAQLARCVDAGCGRLLFHRSKHLPERVISVNGDQFSGCNTVDLAFNLEYLKPPSESLKGRWCALHRELAAERNKYRKIFFLSSLLHAEGSDPELVQALMALGSIPVFSQAEMLPPSETEFDLTVRRYNLSSILAAIVEEGAKTFEDCPEADWTASRWDSDDVEARQHRKWRSKSKGMIESFVGDLDSQLWSWTVETPTNPSYSTYLDVGNIMPKVRIQVELARRSEEFHSYLQSLSRELGQIRSMKERVPALPSTHGTTQPSSRPGFISAQSLFSHPAPNLNRPRPQLFPMLCAELQGSEAQHQPLSDLVDQLSAVEGLQCHQAVYLKELRSSMASTAAPKRLMTVSKDDTTIERALDQNLRCLRKEYIVIRHHLRRILEGKSVAHQICKRAGTSPRISTIFLLQRLSRPFWATLSEEWRRCLVNLALTLIYLQRAERLAEYGRNLHEHWSDLQRELSNPGDHDNPDWDPLEHPESLLLEIEQGILIRPVQNEIAAKMRSPPGQENAVMQLNMGEGKSSVIVPIVAAALADGDRLVRVVVAKPQASQMTHMLIGRLGALINRRVFYLPISRSIRLSRGDVKTIRGIMNTCKTEGGVLLVQPEHLLSFKLMGIDRSWTGENGTMNSLGRKIIRLYRDVEAMSRDIVDESDENFNVKFELIYTIGAQEAVEMSPDRWTLIQELLGITATVVRALLATKAPVASMPGGLLFEDRGAGRVPVIRVLEDHAGRQLVTTLATEVCRLGLRGLPVHHQTTQMRQAVLNYILLDNVAENDIRRVEQADIFSTPTTKSALLLLRGLLAKGVLLFALVPKRFRVNYGLAPDRQPPTRLAVPYRAKDMPSLRSEFSHPDVVIVLTCLSYYYRGLADAELYTCLDLLNNSDQADEEYARWAAACPELPPSFCHFSSINIKDRAQCEGTVFPKLRFAKPVADFYLARVVFPKEMKQFPFKLSASGWDLAKPKAQPLTGFSGTNDSKGVLPLSVKALDLQPHTNATVLSTLLQEDNKVLELGDGGGSQVSALTEDMLLGALGRSEPAMQVILDVGAQVIESSNLQMAKKLLQSASTSSTEAVIFFNDQDELSVLTRNGIVDSFLTSEFATRTDRCLVFLDQAHTRGTDLKLPDHYRAAVTLGPGVTKDTLVQACMRMRKLGQGQWVTFIVSPEMQKRIRGIRKITDGRPLVVQDVLAWAISETWDEVARSVPLWATQGKRHLHQEEVWREVERADGFSPVTLDRYLEPEAMSLEQRYRPRPAADPDAELAASMAGMSLGTQLRPPVTAQHTSQLAAIEAKLAAFQDSTRTVPSSTLQEEQERELAPEIEQERHLSRPPPRTALTHSLHPEFQSFIRTGRIPPRSAFFFRAFAALSDTTAASHFPAPLSTSFPGDLLVTRDFANTVDAAGPGYCSDAFQRGVQWVVTTTATTTTTTSSVHDGGRVGDNMVIVSPWEASWIKRVLDDVNTELELDADERPVVHPAITLHAYLPRASLAFRSMEDLTAYTVPAVPAAGWTAPPLRGLVTQLNLFAGQLYLSSYGEYVALCRYLGLAHTENEGEEAVAQDGFVGRRGYAGCEFEVSPVAFLGEVYRTIRRDCVGIEKTHMGRILAGEILTERDFREGEERGWSVLGDQVSGESLQGGSSR